MNGDTTESHFMPTELDETQQQIRDSVLQICQKYPADYWLEKDRRGGFPDDFAKDIADAGWLGIALPEAYGGSGLGVREAAVMMMAIAESGAGFTGASAVHINIFGLKPVAVHGSEEQKRAWLPSIIRGEDRACFGVTEADAGLDTPRIKTRADRKGDHYVVNGGKIWTSTAQSANKILLLARTAPIETTPNPIDGLTLFYTDLDRAHVQIKEIEKMGRKAVDSNMVFIDGLRVPVGHRIGEEGKGFRYLLEGFNPERILIAAEAVGLGRAALRRATQYARERRVFGRPIGQNQAIQHPLARCWAELEAAELMIFRAAARYDAGKSCGEEANAAKYLAAEAGFHACETAVMTHGGMGYAKEYHVERYLREIMIPRIAPVSREMILSFLAEKALGLPKSY